VVQHSSSVLDTWRRPTPSTLTSSIIAFCDLRRSIPDSRRRGFPPQLISFQFSSLFLHVSLAFSGIPSLLPAAFSCCFIESLPQQLQPSALLLRGAQVISFNYCIVIVALLCSNAVILCYYLISVSLIHYDYQTPKSKSSSNGSNPTCSISHSF